MSSQYPTTIQRLRLVERVSLYDRRMTFELIVVVGIIAIAILLFRIEHSLKQANRNLDQIASALRAKS